jgi:hypothetical protein
MCFSSLIQASLGGGLKPVRRGHFVKEVCKIINSKYFLRRKREASKSVYNLVYMMGQNKFRRSRIFSANFSNIINVRHTDDPTHVRLIHNRLP